MGFRYRKSINLGGGFRVNVSKSGVGYSWGVKGYRVTKTANGKVRRTYSIPGTGISYVDESGHRKPVQQHQYNYSNEVVPSQSTETINVNEYQPAEYKELLDRISKIHKLNSLSTALIWTFLLCAVPAFLATGIAGIFLKIYVHKKMQIPMEYEFDEESRQAYENLCASWMSLNQNKQFWQNVSVSQINQRTSGGASQGVNRIPAKAIGKLPYYMKTNVTPFGLQLRKQQILFLPDKLLIVSGKKVGALNYADVQVRLGTTNFVETLTVPSDASVVNQTWLRVNKNGTPDRRYKANRTIPICEYGTILIESGNTLHVELMCSNSSTIERMKQYSTQIFHS